MSTLRDKAIKGVLWSLTERFGNQAIQFFIGLILARLLLPEDYGLIGMILVFISFAQVFVEGGFSSALIRKTNANDSDYSTVFWFNLIVASICYLLLFFSATFISCFFTEPKLILLTKVVGLNVIVNSLGIIQKTILIKNLNFKTQATINLSSIIISGFIGVYCAYSEFGVWALVIQNLSKNLVMSIAFWVSSNWRPKFIFSKSSFKELYGFGSNLLFSSLINVISENLYSIIIGKLYNAKSLGYYTRANQFQKLPVSSIYGAISAVSFPVLAEIQHEDIKLKEGYRSMIKLVAFVLFPIMAILISISKSMIHVVLTDKWLPSVPILQILCIVGAFYPLHAINLDILKVKGRSDLFFRLEIFKQILNVLMIVVSFKWGVIGLVWGSVMLNFVCYYLNSFFSKSLVNYSFINQVRDLLPLACFSIITLLALFVIKTIITNLNIQLVILPFVGVLVYCFLSSIFKIQEMSILKEIILKIIIKRK